MKFQGFDKLWTSGKVTEQIRRCPGRVSPDSQRESHAWAPQEPSTLKRLASLGWESKWVLSVDTGPYAIPTEKLMKDGLADKIVMWTGNWLDGQAQKLVIKAMKPSWRSVSSSVHQGSTLGPIQFIILINSLGHNGPLTSLQMTPNRKEWQIHQTAMPKRPQEAGKMGWQGSYQVQQGQVQRPASGEEQPQAPLRSGAIPEWAARKQLCKEPVGHEDQHQPAMCPCSKGYWLSWAALAAVLPAGRGRRSCPFHQQWWDLTKVLCPGLGSPVPKRYEHAAELRKRPGRWLQDWLEKGERSGMAESREGSGEAYQCT